MSFFKKITEKHLTKIRFVIVGIWNTIFGYVLFFVLDTLFTHVFEKRYVAYMSAAVLGNFLAIINAYIFHKYLTFISKISGIRILAEFARFFTSYLFSFILGLILLPVIVEMFHIDPKIAAALILVVTVIVSYLSHSRFSFRQR